MKILEKHHKYDPLKRVLESLHELIYIENEISENRIVCTGDGMTITPQIEEISDRMAVLGFHITDPDFDEPLYECCASTGKDIDSAIGSCIGSFIFAFMNGLVHLKNGSGGKPITSTFNGQAHSWKSYNSDLLGMGENVDNSGDGEIVVTKYWDMLKDEIIKRLGNQKMCYVKIFASKAIGKNDMQVTGEVRINDIPSAELSDIIYKHAEGWDVRQFASQKQFFFIKQDNASDLPYSGDEGRRVLADKVKTALELFENVDTDEDYDALPEKLTEALKDNILAHECYSFLPEIAAENAFSEMRFSEQVEIAIDGAEPVKCYKHQLTDYYPLQKTLFSLLSSGVFGEKTDDIYGKLISCSSIYSCVRQMQENGSKLEDCRLTSLLFNATSDFVIR